MTKGKKQDAQVFSFLEGGGTHVQLSDSDYLDCGAAIESGALDGAGRTMVQVSPRSEGSHRIKTRHTALGSLAPTLLEAMGLQEILWNAVISKARPRCERCNLEAERSETIDAALWPAEGYIALVVHGVEESISLREQCELSGFDRAVVDGRLVRVEDLADEEGEPVLRLLSASQRADAERALEEWFARGGVTVRLEHFLSRDAQGSEVQKVFRSWRCPRCSQSFRVLSAQAIEESESCRRCRGEGWLLLDDDRLVACEDCTGFGRTTPFSRYEFLGLPLLLASSIPLSRVFAEIKDEIPASDARRLEALSDMGLAAYPIGAPEALLSRGEHILATLASVHISKPHSLIALVVGADGESEEISGAVKKLGAERSRVISPLSWIPEHPPVIASSEEVFTVRDVARGPLSIAALSFARGGVTVVQGEPGTGKTLLLSEVYKRFAKRKKLSHLSSFGTLRKCFMVESSSQPRGIVLDLLGLGPEFAAEVAKTRNAKERGLIEADLLTPSSKNLCGNCRAGSVVLAGPCAVCLGGVFDSRVGSVIVGKMSVSEMLRRPLSEGVSVFSLNDSAMAVLSKIPVEVRERLTLGTSVSSLEPALRVFLSTISSVGRCLGGRGGAKDSLLLMDRPFATTASFQRLILDAMMEFVGMGGTLICAGVPKALEKVATSVIRLAPSAEEQPTPGWERFFDLRMSRRVSVRVER